MAKCDLCSGQCHSHELAQLRPSYQTAGIVDICPSCQRWADKTKGRLLDAIAPQMRAAIAAKAAAPRRGLFWWLRRTPVSIPSQEG